MIYSNHKLSFIGKGGLRGVEHEHRCVQSADSDKAIVKVHHVEDSDVNIFDDQSVVVFYCADNTSQTE